MWSFLSRIKGEVGAAGIPGVDGRDGHPVSQHTHYLLHTFWLFELMFTDFPPGRRRFDSNNDNYIKW